MSCIQVTTLQFYWSHRICRIVVELVLWQVINDLPVWQFANAHKGMRKNAGSENLSFCQNSTAIFRGRSPSFETERSPAFFERRTVLTICTQSYVESATSVFGKKAILISSFNNFKSTTLIHYTLNQNRLLKIDKFNVEFHRVKTPFQTVLPASNHHLRTLFFLEDPWPIFQRTKYSSCDRNT